MSRWRVSFRRFAASIAGRVLPSPVILPAAGASADRRAAAGCGGGIPLDKPEKAGLVTCQLELSEGRKATKYFELAPFELRLTGETIINTLNADGQDAVDTRDRRNHHAEESSS